MVNGQRNINVRAGGVWGALLGGRHWLALRRLQQEGGGWWNLDSGLPRPQRIGGDDALLEFLRRQVEQRQAIVLRVAANATLDSHPLAAAAAGDGSDT